MPMPCRVVLLAASLALGVSAISVDAAQPASPPAAPAAKKADPRPDLGLRRMDWWRDARIGLLIDWSPAATADDRDKFISSFNPAKFDAANWAEAAKAAGAKYLIVNARASDGFSFFDAQGAEFDVAATPFKRDVLREVVDACAENALTPGFRYAVADGPDSASARLDEGLARGQITELLSNYGPVGVFWFDGPWPQGWTREQGIALYTLSRSTQPNTLVNDRSAGSGGGRGLWRSLAATDLAPTGDFASFVGALPDSIPSSVDWERRVVVNGSADNAGQAIRALSEAASRAGNTLISITPGPDGSISEATLGVLREIGAWAKTNADALRGVMPGPEIPGLAWGRCTNSEFETPPPDRKSISRIFFHVRDWPADGRLVIPNLSNKPISAYLLSDVSGHLPVSRDSSGDDDAIVVTVPKQPPDKHVSVVAVDFEGSPDVGLLPEINAADFFTGTQVVAMITPRIGVSVHYTTDGTDPTAESPRSTAAIIVDRTTTFSARGFRAGKPVSPIARKTVEKVSPAAATFTAAKTPGLAYQVFAGPFDRLPDFTAHKPAREGVTTSIELANETLKPGSAVRYRGFFRAPVEGVYAFAIDSEHEAAIAIDGRPVAARVGKGSIALAVGMHELTIDLLAGDSGARLDPRFQPPQGNPAAFPIDQCVCDPAEN